MKLNVVFALVVAGVTAGVSVSAFAGKEEDQQIKVRQSAYTYLGWNTARIKAQVIEHPESFNKDEVIAAANAIAAVANSGLGKLYGPGTDEGTGWRKSHLKADFFQKPDEVKKVATTFNQEANELAKVAAGGDVSAIRAQFGKLGESCKACHDSFRIKDNP